MTIEKAIERFENTCKSCREFADCGDCEVKLAVKLLYIKLKEYEVTDFGTAVKVLNDYGMFDDETPERLRAALNFIIETWSSEK